MTPEVPDPVGLVGRYVMLTLVMSEPWEKEPEVIRGWCVAEDAIGVRIVPATPLQEDPEAFLFVVPWARIRKAFAADAELAAARPKLWE